MTSYFEPDELPGNSKKGFDSDVATWRTVLEIADSVYKRCVEFGNSAGWQPTGKHYLPLCTD